MDLPKDFSVRMRELIGDEYEDFVKSYDTEINRGVRINTLKCKNGLSFLINRSNNSIIVVFLSFSCNI